MSTTYSKTWKHKGCIIRRRGSRYQVELFVCGRRRRESRPTSAEAEALAVKWADEAKQDGVDALAMSRGDRLAAVDLLRKLPTDGDRAAVTDLVDLLPTDYERLDIKTAVQLFRSGGAGSDLSRPLPSPLAEAVRFWLFHHPADRQGKTLADALQEYTARKAARRPATLQEFKYKLGRFVDDHPGKTVVDITADTIDHWLAVKIGSGLPTRRKYLRLLHGFFRFCCAVYKLPENPAKGVYMDTEETDQTEVEAYTVDEVKRIMAAALKHEEASRVVPVLAIGFFAGLRPSEIKGLDWSNIAMEQRQIRVTPATAKRRRQRFVAMSDNLIEWLLPYVKAVGSVGPAPITFRRDRAEVFKAAKVARWLHDGLRHSYGTYHLAAHADANKTAAEMGHRGNTDLVYQHYRKLVTQDEGLAFWKISPTHCGESDETGVAPCKTV